MAQKLMVQGMICPGARGPEGQVSAAEVRRGMTIRAEDGAELGHAAAVVLESEAGEATHILLSRLPEINGYWLIPVDTVVEVGEETIQLSIPAEEAGALPRWKSI